jgi:hypothetical protein
MKLEIQVAIYFVLPFPMLGVTAGATIVILYGNRILILQTEKTNFFKKVSSKVSNTKM